MKKSIVIIVLALATTVQAQKIIVKPYLQPGNASTLSREQKVVIWQTDSVEASFKVEFARNTASPDSRKFSEAKVTSHELKIGRLRYHLYRAVLSGLDFDAEYTYRVSMDGASVAEQSFQTRTKKPSVRFVAFGDCGIGSPEQKSIAYQVSLLKPQFVLLTGDNVYGSGLMREYLSRFFPAYLADNPSPANGANLMQSVPFYMILGNHDVQAPNLNSTADGLAYFYYNDLPLNAPQAEVNIEPKGNEDRVAAYIKATAPRFPKMSNFSFDYGNIHFLALDANAYANPLDPALLQWIREDLDGTKADWKVVTFHQPGFNSSKSHYDYQIMRLMSPIFEHHGVDLVLNGHVHNYQRSLPLRFDPKKNEKGDQYVVTDEGRVDGKFTLDQTFDGVTNTKPDGIIYIVTGAGGAGLYDAAISNKPDMWKREMPDNWVPFTAKLISDVHSFTFIETDGKKMTLKQMDAQGQLLDQIVITK